MSQGLTPVPRIRSPRIRGVFITAVATIMAALIVVFGGHLFPSVSEKSNNLIDFTGLILDTNSKPIHNASILVDLDQHAPQRYISDTDGFFHVELPGETRAMHIFVSSAGYTSEEREVSPTRTGVERFVLRANSEPTANPSRNSDLGQTPSTGGVSFARNPTSNDPHSQQAVLQSTKQDGENSSSTFLAQTRQLAALDTESKKQDAEPSTDGVVVTGYSPAPPVIPKEFIPPDEEAAFSQRANDYPSYRFQIKHVSRTNSAAVPVTAQLVFTNASKVECKSVTLEGIYLYSQYSSAYNIQPGQSVTFSITMTRISPRDQHRIRKAYLSVEYPTVKFPSGIHRWEPICMQDWDFIACPRGTR